MTDQAAVVAAARSRIGDAYAWGATGPDDFDCSGLIVWAYQQINVTVPRTSQQQAGGGQPVSRDQLTPGDVVIYYPDASHCALYSGDGNVIQSSTYGVPVSEVPIDVAGPYLTARRYLQTEQGNAMTLYGPDLSNNNWNNAAEIAGWLDDCFHTEGYSWMEHKVSEGDYYTDPFWPTVGEWCAANNVPCIGYHYVTTNDPAAQAQTFVNNGGGSVAMLDFEANSGDINNFWAVVNAFNAAGVQITLSYIPHWYWQQIGSPDLSQVPGLIASSYVGSGGYGSVLYENAGGDGGSGWNSYGNATPAVWQFTDGALIGGKSVDGNAFRGDIDQLTALLSIPQTTPVEPPPPPPNLPLFFTIEGHMSDMFSGPAADTATQLESEGLCHHQPIGYNNGAIPFDNQSGVDEVARLVGATVMDNGVPFPPGTPWVLGTFSQGSIVGYDFYEQYLAPGQPLAWREQDRLGTLAYGDPNRATGSIAPWAVGQVTTPGTHGLDPYKRFGLPGCPAIPPNFMDDYREGDIFAENGDDQASQIKSAVYQAVARSDVFSNPFSLAAQIGDLFNTPATEVIGIIQAIVSGVVFLADNPNPHYSPYDITGGLNWCRGLLQAAA